MTEQKPSRTYRFDGIRPLAKERPRKGKYGQIYTPGRTQRYEAALGLLAKTHYYGSPLDVPVSVEVVFITPGGKLRGDIDNFLKSLFDGGNRIIWSDDRMIHKVHARVEKGGKGTWGIILTVTPL